MHQPNADLTAGETSPNLTVGRISRSQLAFALRLFVALAFTFAVATAHAQTNPKHIFWIKGSPNAPSASSSASDLIYHGGNAGSGAIGVETKPAVYLIFWGPDWANGFTTTDLNGQVFTSQTLQTYVQSFLSNMGGTSWSAIQTEYCNNVPAGTTSCDAVGGGTYVTNPRNQLKGVWTDATPVPSDIVTLGLAENLVDDPIATEAMRASAHFNYDPQATYIILTPPTPIATGQSYYCGYHSQTSSLDGLGNPYRLQYAFIPFLNTSLYGQGCGMNTVTWSVTALATACSTVTASWSATSTPRRSRIPTTSPPSRTAGTTRKPVRTATSAPGNSWPTST